MLQYSFFFFFSKGRKINHLVLLGIPHCTFRIQKYSFDMDKTYFFSFNVKIMKIEVFLFYQFFSASKNMIRKALSINLIMILSLTIHHLQVITSIIWKHNTPESYVCVSHYQYIINTRKINTKTCFSVPL